MTFNKVCWYLTQTKDANGIPGVMYTCLAARMSIGYYIYQAKDKPVIVSATGSGRILVNSQREAINYILSGGITTDPPVGGVYISTKIAPVPVIPPPVVTPSITETSLQRYMAQAKEADSSYNDDDEDMRAWFGGGM